MSRPSARHTLPLLLLLGACGGARITGEVVDGEGDPVEGARVAAIGTVCATTSDASGRFELTCPPGEFDLVISAEGYTDRQLAVEAAKRGTFDIGRQVLVRIPESEGLFLFSDDEYRPMKPGRLVRQRRKEGDLVRRAICLDREHSEPNTVKAGTHKLFDNEHPGWRPFRLDDEGCAYRDTRNRQHRWKVEYRKKAKYTVNEVNPGKRLVEIEFEPGDYFIADWKGFFVADDEKYDDGRVRYTGYWVQVR